MNSIRRVTKFLINISILYVIFFCIALHFKILNTTTEAIMINLMTGFITSALISFVEYNIKLNENITYFMSDLLWYYRTLSRLKRGLNSSISINEKINAISEELKYINSHARNKKQLIDVDLLFYTRKNKNFTKKIEDTYDITFGIELGFVEVKYNAKEIKKLKDKKKYVDSIKEMIEVEILQIEHNLKGLNKFQLYNNWTSLKEKYLLIDEKNFSKNI